MQRLFSPAHWFCFLAVGLLGLAGCEKDEIRSYTVQRPPPETIEATVRLLAAVFIDGPNQWFFKLVGPNDVVSKHAKEFDDFVESVRFTDKAGDPVEWKIPATWEKTAPSNMRYAGFFMGPKGKAPELTVFKFDKISPLMENVDRWCRIDLGRKAPHDEAELAQFTKAVRAGDKVGERIDMTGPGVRGGKPPMAGLGDIGPMRRPKALPLTYTAPAGWEETGPRSVMGITILTAFQVREGDQRAEAQVTALPGMAGGLLANVNRWRGQVGLPDTTQADLDKNPPRTIRVAGKNAPYYDLAGPARRMLLTTVEHGGQTWYLKLLGGAEVVGKNKSKYESFVQSVKFTGAADE